MRDTKEHDNRITETNKKSNQVCKFFLRGIFKGRCIIGTNCNALHSTDDGRCLRCFQSYDTLSFTSHVKDGCPKSLFPSYIKGDKRTGICPNFIKGQCYIYDTDCPLFHLDKKSNCLFCGNKIINMSLREHLKICSEWQSIQVERKDTKNFICSICYRPYKEKPVLIQQQKLPDGRIISIPSVTKKIKGEPITSENFATFAMLPNCLHTFCMDCIIKWRGGLNRHDDMERTTMNTHIYDRRFQCPICRAKTPFVIPVDRVISTQLRQTKEMQKYIKELKIHRCRFFKQPFRNGCKHGDNCFFNHKTNANQYH